MDAYEATGVVFSRIQALDPDNAAKIMGLLLIQDHGDKEMIRLAFGPEALLHSVILKARKDLGLLSPSTPLSLLSRQNSSRIGHSSPSPWAPQLPFSISNISDDGVVDDEFLLHEQQLSLLNDQAADPGGYWDQGGLGWKPCLYFARGFCKNGSSCRFVHGPADDMSAAAAAVEQQYQEIMLLRSKSQRLAASAAAAAAAFPYSPAGSSSRKNLNFMLQQLQDDSQRAAAAALMLENDDHKFMDRPRMERDFIGMMNPGSRQIYLTFPADSTFREEDVSNYFSIYGSVQDVRIPYQQKRMFGFVTFVYPETVKLILAKGNPHFVCDARVLVKPYKEKGKIPDKKQQHGERFDFSGCTTPTELDSRGPFDLQQLTSPRMMYGGNNHELLLRRKMEEQQAAVKLQQAIEMQGRRFMGLQLLDIKNQSLASPTAPILSPLATPNSTTFNNTSIFSDAGSSSNGSQDEDTSLSPAASATATLSTAADKQQTAVNSGESEPIPIGDINYQESAEHNLPDSPFASPTKSDIVSDSNSFPLANEEITIVTIKRSSNGHLNASSLQPPSPHEGMNSLK